MREIFIIECILSVKLKSRLFLDIYISVFFYCKELILKVCPYKCHTTFIYWIYYSETDWKF